MNSDTIPFPKNSMFVPRSLCFFPIDTVSSPKFADIASMVLEFTCSSMRDTLFLSNYQAIVQCLPSTVIFFMHLSYGLITNPYYLGVFVYRSYHNSAESMQPYKYFNSFSYSTFPPFPCAHFSYVQVSPST